MNACEQSENNWLPALREPRQLHELELPEQTIIAHPATDSVKINPDHEALLLVGPEGVLVMRNWMFCKKAGETDVT